MLVAALVACCCLAAVFFRGKYRKGGRRGAATRPCEPVADAPEDGGRHVGQIEVRVGPKHTKENVGTGFVEVPETVPPAQHALQSVPPGNPMGPGTPLGPLVRVVCKRCCFCFSCLLVCVVMGQPIPICRNTRRRICSIENVYPRVPGETWPTSRRTPRRNGHGRLTRCGSEPESGRLDVSLAHFPCSFCKADSFGFRPLLSNYGKLRHFLRFCVERSRKQTSATVPKPCTACATVDPFGVARGPYADLRNSTQILRSLGGLTCWKSAGPFCGCVVCTHTSATSSKYIWSKQQNLLAKSGFRRRRCKSSDIPSLEIIARHVVRGMIWFVGPHLLLF